MALKISRVLHAGYVFESGGTRIICDPLFENPFSRNCHAFPDVKFDLEQIQSLKFDAVFISHYHDDHCSFESLNLIDRTTPVYMYCVFEEMFSLLRDLGFNNVFPLELDTPVKMGSIEVIPRQALDADVDSLLQIQAEDLNILNVVDSWIDYSTLDYLSRNGPWDLVLWPFQTMRELEVLSPSRAEPASRELPPEWIGQLKVLKPKYVVPSSCQFQFEEWSWYNQAFFPINYKEFEKEVSLALRDSRVIRMNPSVSVTLSKEGLTSSEPLEWVKPSGTQDVDYDYNPDLKPPVTAEIAKHFAPLSESQTQRVLNYCQLEILERYKSLGPTESDYFEDPLIWKLSVYDHTGKPFEYRYRIEGESIEHTLDDNSLGWLTEIPISRFYAALELGESLTSLYMRINDVKFVENVEKAVESVDLVEDPLLRCLFNGEFGSYQKAQLKRILKG